MTEPTTTITDYALAAVAFAASARLFARSGVDASASGARRLWAAAILATGAAALLGGSYHGFRGVWPTDLVAAVWRATLLSVGFAGFSMLVGAAALVLPGRWSSVVSLVAGIKLVSYAIWVWRHPDFRYAVYDYAPAMLVVAVLALFGWRRQRAWARWTLIGLLVSFAAAAVEGLGLSLHRHFNHNDLYHVIQIGGIIALYRAGTSITGEG